MATREEKQIRLELPSTSDVECEIRESLSREEYVFTFYQNERTIKTSTMACDKVSKDQMVDLLSDTGVEFFSFSAIFDVAELLVESIKKGFQESITGGEVVVESTEDTVREDFEVVDTTITPEPSIDMQVSIEPESKVYIDPGDKLLKKFEMPYSQEGDAGVYYCRDGKYSIVLFHNDTPIIRKKFSKDSINEENLVALISESGIDFLSFSSIYDSAEQIQNIILHPEEHIESEGVPIDATTEIEADTIPPPNVEVSEDEMVMVDLSSLDVSKYNKAEDFDKFIAEVTTFVNEGQPLPVKEVEIERSGGVVCIILRQMDSWFLRFRAKSGKLSKVTEIKIDQDEIARLINQEIPQISFSYLYDASEKVYLAIEHLAKRPMGGVILNVAVGHFLQIIEQHEIEGDFKAAAQITEVLLERFRNEQNTKGILQFGKKLLNYLEKQKQDSKAIKLRNELTGELLEIDLAISLEFVQDSLNSLEAGKKYLNAANLCGLLLDHYLTMAGSLETLKNILTLGRRQIDFYKSARLPSVMEENGVRYAHYAIRQIHHFDDQLTPEEKEAYHNNLIYLLDQAFESQEERKANFELLEALENTLNLLEETEDKKIYLRYFDKLLVSLETQGKKKKALKVAIEAAKFLLDSDNYVKACDYGNRAIKLFYELDQIPEAIDFSLDIVRDLVNIKETTAARDYLKFVESLVNKAYKTDDKSRVEKHLIIGDLYGKLGLKDQAKAYIQAALQTIGEPKKREKIVLDYVGELLISHATLSAQEMINHELSRLLNAQKIKEGIKFCQNFIAQLQEYNQHDMVFEYMKYSASLMIQTEHPDYKILNNFIKDLKESNALDRAAFILNQLITLQYNQKDYTKAIDGINQFIDFLVEKTERFDLVEYYIDRVVDTYREMGDTEGVVDALLVFQRRMLDHSIELAQKITDTILKDLEAKEDFKKSISIVSLLIEKQLELGKYEDAYIFSVQNARYYERLGDIGKVIQYLEDIRDKFLNYEQFQDANRMTDLILRFGRSHKKYKQAITSMKDYSKSALDRGDTTTSTKFALEMAKLLEEENQGEKALEFLQMIFNTIYDKEDQESALKVFQRIMEIKAERDEFKKIVNKYLIPLIHKYPNIQLIEITKQTIKPPFEEFFSFGERIYDDMLEFDQISDELPETVINFVISAYNEGWGDEGDRIANKYASKFLDIDKVPFASRLMATVLERTEQPVSEVIPASFDFIKGLINNSLLEDAREYTDRVITMVTSEKKFGSESRVLAAKIAEKFAVNVASENPDLASEYAYQASTFYRSINDFEGVVTVYTNLANKIPSPKQAIRTFKRGIKICNKFKAAKYEAKLLSHLTEYLISTNNVAAIASFQQTLEKYEELQDLDDLFKVVFNLINVAIKSDNLKIAYSYLDYLSRLSTMINRIEDIGGIMVFLLRHAEEAKDDKRIELVQKYIKELDLKPKKYKKDYAILAGERIAHMEAQFGEMKAVELEEEPEPVPELVKTKDVVPPPLEAPSTEVSQEMIEEEIDEEFVSLIKEFGQEETQIQASQEEQIPTPDEIPTQRVDEPSVTEFSLKEPEVVRPEIDDLIEPPATEEPDIAKTGALSDDEIRSLFSASTTLKPKVDVPPESFSAPLEEVLPDEKRTALSEEELDSLFIPSAESPSIDVEQSKVGRVEIPDDEWEVDSFGRLWKKGTIAPSKETPTDFEPEEPPVDVSVATPDLSPLEKIIQEDTDKEVTEDIATDIFKEVFTEQEEVVPEESQIESIADVLNQEEKTVSTDIFDVPQVDYQEITPPQETKESEVKIPDLADLFSDALSELGTISGETGKGDEEKKKKK
ncbi:MAG: tetratricopeptide repeat protein [Candidatus Thorarchaeota archaeon]